jgi:MFS family permease
MTALAAATGLGYAIGAALAGRLADWGGHTPAYAVTVVAGAAAVTLSWTCGRVLTTATEQLVAPAAPAG